MACQNYQSLKLVPSTAPKFQRPQRSSRWYHDSFLQKKNKKELDVEIGMRGRCTWCLPIKGDRFWYREWLKDRLVKPVPQNAVMRSSPLRRLSTGCELSAPRWSKGERVPVTAGRGRFFVPWDDRCWDHCEIRPWGCLSKCGVPQNQGFQNQNTKVLIWSNDI